MLCLVFVVILSITILGRRFNLTQYFAVAIVILGLSVISFETIMGANDGEDEN